MTGIMSDLQAIWGEPAWPMARYFEFQIAKRVAMRSTWLIH